MVGGGPGVLSDESDGEGDEEVGPATGALADLDDTPPLVNPAVAAATALREDLDSRYVGAEVRKVPPSTLGQELVGKHVLVAWQLDEEEVGWFAAQVMRFKVCACAYSHSPPS
jgi:hypothetical protein